MPKHVKLRQTVESVENPMKVKVARTLQLNVVNAMDLMKHGTNEGVKTT